MLQSARRIPDPSKTAMIRHAFADDAEGHFVQIDDAIRRHFKERSPFSSVVPFEGESHTLRRFKVWLELLLDQKLLKPNWTDRYIQQAYKKGAVRSFHEVKKTAMSPPMLAPDADGWVRVKPNESSKGALEHFLWSLFSKQQTSDRMGLLQTRVHDNLTDICSSISTQAGRLFLDSKNFVKQMTGVLDTIVIKRVLATARTEPVRAQAEGQLDGFEQLGIKRVSLVVEDGSKECECVQYLGKVFSIEDARGMITFHVGCRCAWSI